MTVLEAIEYLQNVENKEMNIFLMGEGGFYTICAKDSGESKDENGEEIFILLPCYGHGEALEIDVKGTDFEITEN